MEKAAMEKEVKVNIKEMQNSSESREFANIAEQQLCIAEMQQLLEIFPREIWEAILMKIKDSWELHTISNSSLAFREILSLEQTGFLFSLIWNILVENLEQYELQCQTYEESDSEEDQSSESESKEETRIMPFQNDKWYSWILQMRFVCRTWNHTIDNYYSNHSRHFNNNSKNSLCEFSDTFVQNMTSAWAIIQHFHPTHSDSAIISRSPFLSKSVILNNNGEPENVYQTYEHFGNLLMEFGQHIWYLTINITHSWSTDLQFYPILLQFLSCTPNLKRLEFYNNIVFTHPRLQETINSNPLPSLDSLQCLSIVTEIPTTVALMNAITSRYNHVSKLNIAYFTEEPSKICNEISNVQWPNLQHLDIQFYSDEKFWEEQDSLESLKYMELHNDSYLDSEIDFFHWSEFFESLESIWFAHTLKKLVITLPFAFTPAEKGSLLLESENLRLNLPTVTELTIKMKNCANLDFLLPMVDSLNSLEIWAGFPFDFKNKWSLIKVEEKQTIQFWSCFEQPLESNLWLLYTNLKNLKLVHNFFGNIKVCKLTRKEWITRKSNTKL